MRLPAGLIAAILGIAIWQAVVWITQAQHFILPSPARVATAAINSRALIAEHALITLSEVVLGMIFGTVLGVILAIWLASSDGARRVVQPLLVFSQAVPVFALAPILTLWFGYGIESKIAMAILIIFFPVASAFHDGLMRVDRGIIDLAQTMGATKYQIMRRIRIPGALPSLGTGLRLAAVYAPIGAVIGEWVGSSKGLGYLMLLANGRAKIDLMFAAVIALAILAMSMHALVGLLVRRLEDYSEGASS